jgi:hypothetical protein
MITLFIITVDYWYNLPSSIVNGTNATKRSETATISVSVARFLLWNCDGTSGRCVNKLLCLKN